jgi:PKD domain
MVKQFVLLIVIICFTLWGCKKNNANTQTNSGGTYTITCWNKSAGEITNFRSNNDHYKEKWDFGDGTAIFLPLGSGAGNVGPIDHIYKAPGIYTITLIVNDDTAHAIHQEDTIAPNYWFHCIGTPIVGDTIYFRFSAYLPASGVSYLWTFGDGTSSTDSTPYHIFNSSGNFVVKLTINGNPADPNIWESITIYKDPVYTHQMTNLRLWHGTEHDYYLYDSAAYNVRKTLPDSSFAIKYIEQVTISLDHKYTFDPSLSSGNVIVFSYGTSSPYLSTIYYDHVKDSLAVYLFNTYQAGPGKQPIAEQIWWHSP